MFTRVAENNLNFRGGRPNTRRKDNALQLHAAQRVAVGAVWVEQLAGGGAILNRGPNAAVELMRTWEEIGTANKKRCANEANTGEAGTGMGRHAPQDEGPGGRSVVSPADGSAYPLAPLKRGEAPYGAEAASRGSSTSLRPYVVPYTDVKPAAPGKLLGPDDNGVTLRYDITRVRVES